MAISNFTELKTAVATWLHRDDLTAVIPDMIAVAEARLNRELRLLNMEATASVTLTTGLNYAALPTGYLEGIDLYYASDNEQLVKLTAEEIIAIRPETGTGKPGAYAVTSRFEFEITADETYTLTSRHLKRWDIAADATNWLLTNSPGAYLYAALAEAGMYLKNDARVPMWEAKAAAEIRRLNHTDGKARSRPLRVDPALRAMPYHSYRIETEN